MPLYHPPTQNALQKTLGAQLLTGVTASATLNNTTGVQNKAGVFVVDRVNAAGVATDNKREYISFSGTSGSTVTTLVRGLAGSTDQDHAVGAIVEFIPDVVWGQALVTALENLVNTSTLAVDTTKVVTPSAPAFVLGSDAHGDMYVRNSGASIGRIPKGTFGQQLQMTATLPGWSYQNFSPWNTITDASTMYIDFSLGTKFMATVVPSGARTFLATNATLGSVAMLRVKYASTASIAVNFMTAAATISWYGGGTAPVGTCVVNKVDLFGFACTATLPEFDGVVIGQNRG